MYPMTLQGKLSLTVEKDIAIYTFLTSATRISHDPLT